jgi:hypothetical protein
VSPTLETIRAWAQAYETGGPRALMDATIGHTNHIYVADLRSGAMNEAFGPCGLHPSRANEDGSPTAETLATCPGVARAVERGREQVERTLRYLLARAA